MSTSPVGISRRGSFAFASGKMDRYAAGAYRCSVIFAPERSHQNELLDSVSSCP